jgi:peptidoglycan/xylan/chitin deacetylase (PgdA/CDA1 family)
VVPLAGQYVPATAVLGQWTPLRALPGELVRWQGPRFPGNVALTFDDGPHPVATPAILDRLDELAMKASFFPLASLAERHSDVLAEIARRGHTVGTHGYEHVRHLGRGPRWIRRDLEAADRAMAALDSPTTWYRPAYGIVTGATLLAARRRGWRTVLWSAWGREWATRDPRSVAARIGRRLRPGAIVLLHDNDLFGPAGMWRVALEALEPLAARLCERRLAPVTLDEHLA